MNKLSSYEIIRLAMKWRRSLYTNLANLLRVAFIKVRSKIPGSNIYIAINSIFVLLHINATATERPNFNCASATKLDEIAICNDAQLSKLDMIASKNYEYIKDNLGADQANIITIPAIKLRQQCGSNKSCILGVQRQTIAQYHSYGALVAAQATSKTAPSIIAEEPVIDPPSPCRPPRTP